MKWIKNILTGWGIKLANKKINKMAKTKSPNTTAAGIGTVLTVVGAGLIAFFDGDPETNIDFTLIVITIVGFIQALGFLKSKDADATHSGNPTK